MAFDWLPARPAMRPRSRSFHGRASALAVYRSRSSTTDASFAPFNQRRSAERQAEIDERRRQFASAPGVAPSDEDLFSYLFLLALQNAAPDEDELDRLRRGNRIVHETREHMSGGRGNVWPDQVRTGLQSRVNVNVARDLMANLAGGQGWSRAEAATISGAAAMYLRSGNCYEHADLATLRGTTTLKPSEAICKVSSRPIEHLWAELRADRTQASNRDVILDAWSDGVSPLREHSRFAANPKSAKVKFALDTSYGTRHHEMMLRRYKRISEDEELLAFIEQRRNTRQAKIPSGPVRWSAGVWPAMPTLSDKFIARSAANREKLGRRPNGPLLRQIMMAGAARHLGANVAQAARADERFRPPAPLAEGARAPRGPLLRALGRRLRYVRHLIVGAARARLASWRTRRNRRS